MRRVVSAVFLVIVLGILFLCGFLLSLGDLIGSSRNLDSFTEIRRLRSEGVLPSGGACRNAGVSVAGNPFYGWPLRERVCDWNAVSALYCSPYYGLKRGERVDLEKRKPHWGMDFAWYGITGEEVVATGYGVVVQSVKNDQWNYGMGNFVQVRATFPICEMEYEVDIDGDGRIDMETCEYGCETDFGVDLDKDGFISPRFCGDFTEWYASYFHLLDVAVSAGFFVRPGDVLGYVGDTGNSSGPHLHYQINQGRFSFSQAGAVDPLPTLGCGWTWEEGIARRK